LDDESDPTYDELHDVFESLYDEFKKLGSKYSTLKKNCAYLLVEKETLEKKACIVIGSVLVCLYHNSSFTLFFLLEKLSFERGITKVEP
jgi:hypothetical protein